MLKISYEINGVKQDKDLNSKQTIYQQMSNHQFVLFEEQLYTTQKIEQELLVKGNTRYNLNFLTNDEVVKRFNIKRDNEIKMQQEKEKEKEKENLQFQLQKQQTIDVQDKLEKQQLLQENRKLKQFLGQHLHCLSGMKQKKLFPGQLVESYLSIENQKVEDSEFNITKLTNSVYEPANQVCEPAGDEQKIKQNLQFQTQSLEQFIQIQEQQLSLIKKQTSSRIYNSMLTTVESKCDFCQITIRDQYIKTPCLHSYHEECLVLSIKAQLMENPQLSRLKCLCSKYFSLKILMIFYDRQFSQLVKMQIIDNQLNEIMRQKQHPYTKCSREYCEFFCIKTNDNDCYCPVCLETVKQK